MAKKQARTKADDPIVDELMARYDHAYVSALERFITFEGIQQAYDNNINTMNWPTISEIGFPVTFVSVEEQLPFVMKYLFPRSRFLSLIPDLALDNEIVTNIEDDLIYTLRTEMDIEHSSLPAIKDCYKFGVGYSLIDTAFISPPRLVNNILLENGNPVSQVPQIVLGEKKQTVVHRNLSVIQVVPMPDGANVDGPNKASGHFVVDIVTESEFRAMYERKNSEGNPMFMGNVDSIVNQARHMNFDARHILADTMHRLSGYDIPTINQGDRKIPVVIPIVRCYFDHEETWIANGTTRIWEVKDKFQNLQSDLIKWSAWPDGTRWFPMNITEASERMAYGMNIWYNGLVDLAMYMMNPTRIINTQIADDPNIGRGPQADIKVSGDPQKAVQYMDLPQFPTQLFEMGQVLQTFHSNANAQLSTVRGGQAGLVRGGSNALETLLATSTGRQLLAASAVKSGALKPLIEKVLIKKQMIISEGGNRFVDTTFNGDTGKREFAERTVTRADMRNIFRVELDLQVARMNSAADFAEDAAFFDRAQQQPDLFDQRELYADLANDEAKVRRVMLPENVVRDRQERKAEANLAAAERGEQVQNSNAAITEGQQALAGAANLGGEQ